MKPKESTTSGAGSWVINALDPKGKAIKKESAQLPMKTLFPAAGRNINSTKGVRTQGLAAGFLRNRGRVTN